jgi:hypothetical protein
MLQLFEKILWHFGHILHIAHADILFGDGNYFIVRFSRSIILITPITFDE